MKEKELKALEKKVKQQRRDKANREVQKLHTSALKTKREWLAKWRAGREAEESTVPEETIERIRRKVDEEVKRSQYSHQSERPSDS